MGNGLKIAGVAAALVSVGTVKTCSKVAVVTTTGEAITRTTISHSAPIAASEWGARVGGRHIDEAATASERSAEGTWARKVGKEITQSAIEESILNAAQSDPLADRERDERRR